MTTEIANTQLFPYSAIVSIRSTFADGRVTLGSGALVGKNDVLTATHVVYQPDRGGYAKSIEVIPGADFNGSKSVLELAPYGSFFSGSVVAFPAEAFSDANNASTTLLEVSSDVAVIGLKQSVGFTAGWLGLATGHNSESFWATEIGYPGTGTGMMAGSTLAHADNGLWISAYGYEGSALLGPGSSGGPLYYTPNGLPEIAGVKSSGTSYVNYWADIDYKYDAIVAAIKANDSLIGGSNFVSGTNANDSFIGSASNLVIDGSMGVDTVSYALTSSQVKIRAIGNREGSVVSLSNPSNGDVLTNVERIKLKDTMVALDIAKGEHAGDVYRLYEAILNRAPEAEGLGFWINVLDRGYSLGEVTKGFINSPEYQKLYGTTNDNATFVGNLYQFVLHRTPEAEGYEFWNGVLQANPSAREQVLMDFANSTENVAQVAQSVSHGIVYTQWLG